MNIRLQRIKNVEVMCYKGAMEGR